MYVIPLIAIIVLGLLAVAWNPIFALVIFVLFMLGYFAFVGMRPSSDEEVQAPRATPGRDALTDDEDTGLWGEGRPS
jgi:hypothetical protein